MLLEEFLKPMGISQVKAARRLRISLNRLNEIVLGRVPDCDIFHLSRENPQRFESLPSMTSRWQRVARAAELLHIICHERKT
jgi:hypothetical protein